LRDGFAGRWLRWALASLRGGFAVGSGAGGASLEVGLGGWFSRYEDRDIDGELGHRVETSIMKHARSRGALELRQLLGPGAVA
jgi:hypothetical protein